ncbi:DUF6286 domain-containing protein [Streptomyces cinnamoneus]|uniref:DUF6286 domain-containing protein n=1 Tax=Streptomyces cinnamoneus TaxID=53446 RepID=UPI0034465B46
MSGVPLQKTPPDAPPPGDGAAHRFWSVRRLPAAFVAAAVLAAAGLLLYDVVSVRTGHPAMRWRRRLARELAERPLGDGWVTAGAAVAVLLGLWLIVLAVTPGLRGVLPMRRAPGVRAGLDRRAAALVLRDRALTVSGVQSVRVDVGRRVVRARAQAHFRDLDEVRTDVNSVLAEGVRELGLAREPSLSVHVRRAAKG